MLDLFFHSWRLSPVLESYEQYPADPPTSYDLPALQREAQRPIDDVIGPKKVCSEKKNGILYYIIY